MLEAVNAESYCSVISMQFVDAFSTVFSGYSEIFRQTLVEYRETWASDVAAIKDAAVAKLDELIAYYEK